MGTRALGLVPHWGFCTFCVVLQPINLKLSYVSGLGYIFTSVHVGFFKLKQQPAVFLPYNEREKKPVDSLFCDGANVTHTIDTAHPAGLIEDRMPPSFKPLVGLVPPLLSSSLTPAFNNTLFFLSVVSLPKRTSAFFLEKCCCLSEMCSRNTASKVIQGWGAQVIPKPGRVSELCQWKVWRFPRDMSVQGKNKWFQFTLV